MMKKNINILIYIIEIILLMIEIDEDTKKFVSFHQ
jgi:hypothetical protein